MLGYTFSGLRKLNEVQIWFQFPVFFLPRVFGRIDLFHKPTIPDSSEENLVFEKTWVGEYFQAIQYEKQISVLIKDTFC